MEVDSLVCVSAHTDFFAMWKYFIIHYIVFLWTTKITAPENDKTGIWLGLYVLEGV